MMGPRSISPSARALFALSFALAACAQEGEEERKAWNYLEDQLTVADEFKTPCTQWAKPYAGGTVRVLFFAPWFQGSTDGREIVELMQRFDIDGQAAYVVGGRLIGDGAPDWYGGDAEAGTKRVRAFMDGGVDAIFVNQLTLDAIPEAIREELLRRVQAGAGLVVVGNDVAPPEGAAPATQVAAGPRASRFYALGQGRVAVLPSRARLQYRLGWDTELDYQMQEQGQALLWAVNREPHARIKVGVTSVDRDELPAERVEIATEGVTAGTSVRVDLRRWDGDRSTLASLDGPVAGAHVSLPKLRAGAYHIDCFATRAGKTETWATAPFTVTAASFVDWVRLEQDWCEPGDPIAGRFALQGTARRTEWIDLRLVDARGRIIQREKLRRDGDAGTFRVNVPRWAPALLRVEAVLMDKESEVSSAFVYLNVTNRKRGQFNFVMWNCPGGDLAPFGAESMTRYGVTAFLQQGPPPRYVAACDAAWVPYAASFRASSHTVTAMLDPDTGTLKNGCVYDRASMEKAIAAAVDGVRAARGHGVLVYSLGDENAVRASCLGPDCLRAYQQYLQKVYGDIASLNAEWNAAYATFGDIQLLSDGPLPAPDASDEFKEYFTELDALQRSDNEGAKGAALDRQIAFGNINDELRALQHGNYARWYDRQAFQCVTYVEWCKKYQAAFRAIDPQALTGFEGTDSFSLRKLTTRSRQGGDLDAFVRELGYFGSYEGPGNEVMRSIAPNGFPLGSWIGYTPDVEELRYKFWQQAADRMNTIQWWRWDNLQGYNGYLAPNLAPFPAVRDMFEDTQVVRDGLGALSMQSNMHDDGIAMLYSMPSTYIAHFDGNEGYGLYARDHNRWHELLHDEGLQFRYVTDRMLRLGEFDASRYKVLILPLAFAMAPEEAAAVRAYVKAGGTLIADLRPAMYDGHCKPREQGQLNDVFGIEHASTRGARSIDRMRVSGEIAGKAFAMQWGNWHGHDVYPQMTVDPNVALTTGKGTGEADFIHYWTGGLTAPVCIVNEFGKGRAVLLNFSVFNAPCAALLRGLLAASGVTPAVRPTTPDGAPVRNVEVSRWSNGSDEFIILLGKYDGDVHVAIPEAREVYDVKGRQYLGHTDSFVTKLRPNRGAVFAFLPNAAEAPRMTAPPSVRRGTAVDARVRVPHVDGARAIIVTLTAPDGRAADWVRSPIVVGNKAAAVTLPFAFNDALGEWKLRVTDLYSQKSTTATIAVE